MEITKLHNDIIVFYIPAKSFPQGIQEAHQTLHGNMPFSKERKYFGLSRPENGMIRYKAAAEALAQDEPDTVKLKTMTIKKGDYISQIVLKYQEDLQSIDRAFKELLLHPGLDPQGYCVEWYLNDQDVKCMIRLDE